MVAFSTHQLVDPIYMVLLFSRQKGQLYSLTPAFPSWHPTALESLTSSVCIFTSALPSQPHTASSGAAHDRLTLIHIFYETLVQVRRSYDLHSAYVKTEFLLCLWLGDQYYLWFPFILLTGLCLFFNMINFNFICMSILPVYHIYAWHSQMLKRGISFLKPELQTGVSCYVVPVNWTLVLFKSSRHI